MAKHDFLLIVGVDVRTFVCPKQQQISAKHWQRYVLRCAAVRDVAGGLSVAAAAKLHKVDRRTVTRDCEIAMEEAIDGLRVGFRACIPHQHRRPTSRPATSLPAPPCGKGSHAFSQLLHASPKLRKLVEGYKGGLPTGKVKNLTFGRLFDQFKAVVRAEIGDKGYPFSVKDEGRRALLQFIKRARTAREEAGAPDIEAAEPNITRFNQIFHLGALDRIEFDAHKTDVDWCFNLSAPNGKVVQRRIECVTLLAAVCAATRYLLGYVLVLGTYNRLDVLRLFHKVLSPWRPRSLIVPSMHYPEGALVGLPIDDSGAGPRAIVIAGDNALMHHATICVENLTEHHRGILNFGPAHVPEIRPFIEAFFRLIEQGALRNVAGGFQPETRVNSGKKLTSFLRAEDHPIQWEGLIDLMDVIAAGYNVTPHSGLGGRTPASVLNTHLSSGWSWNSSDALADAARLTTVRFSAQVRGDKVNGRQPFVQYYDAYYRSQRLMGKWDLVGKRFAAEANIEDLRHVVLLNPDDGTPWSRLTALPPWDRTPHDLHLRQQIIRARNRKLLEIVGSHDAIEAYHQFTRRQALTSDAPPDLYARIDTQSKPSAVGAQSKGTRPAVHPRSGHVSFAHRKD